MSRTQDIAKEILSQLATATDPLDEAVLNHLLNARFSPGVDFTELADALRVLGDAKMVGRNNHLGGPRWFITGRGRAELHA